MGTCVMDHPGILEARRVPVQVRLFVAVALSMAILPDHVGSDIYPSSLTSKGHLSLASIFDRGLDRRG
jgi:flagellar biosynthetic protein FliR